MNANIIALLALVGVLGPVMGQNWDQMIRSRCWSSGNGRPAQWWNEGERIDRGKYWYQCERGELSPRGCFSEDNTRISIGGTFDSKGYEISCVVDREGYLVFKTSACIGPNGVHYKQGETWTDPKNVYYYECQQDGPYLKVSVVGCLSHDKSRKLPLGEKYDFGEYTYQCMKKYNGSIQMCSVGCIHNGQHYNVGQQWPDNDYVFYCKLNKGRCQKICVGCQFRNKRLYDGDRYQLEKTVYQCEIRPDSFGRKPVGCVATDNYGSTIERVIGCRWYLENKDSKIEQTCELEGEKTVVKTVGCIYRYKNFDTLFLNPGTYTIWNKPGSGESVGVSCKETSDGARLETFSVEQMYLSIQGLKYDAPRG